MALIVGSIAIPYIGYVTWDEYTAKPYVDSQDWMICTDFLQSWYSFRIC